LDALMLANHVSVQQCWPLTQQYKLSGSEVLQHKRCKRWTSAIWVVGGRLHSEYLPKHAQKVPRGGKQSLYSTPTHAQHRELMTSRRRSAKDRGLLLIIETHPVLDCTTSCCTGGGTVKGKRIVSMTGAGRHMNAWPGRCPLRVLQMLTPCI